MDYVIRFVIRGYGYVMLLNKPTEKCVCVCVGGGGGGGGIDHVHAVTPSKARTCTVTDFS